MCVFLLNDKKNANTYLCEDVGQSVAFCKMNINLVFHVKDAWIFSQLP